MALWTINLAVYGEQLEYQCDLPDAWTEDQVYDFVLDDIEIDLTKED